jgi:hypothetical protein
MVHTEKPMGTGSGAVIYLHVCIVGKDQEIAGGLKHQEALVQVSSNKFRGVRLRRQQIGIAIAHHNMPAKIFPGGIQTLNPQARRPNTSNDGKVRVIVPIF